MNMKTGKIVYSSCLFSSALGLLLCASIITADKLSSDLTSNLIANQLVQAEQSNHHKLAQFHSGDVHRV